jgi:hypothetical protein
VERYDAGWTAGPPGGVPPERIRAEILDSPEAVARKGANASALAREVFSWDRAVAPLVEAVRTGGRNQRREVDVSVAWPEDHSLAVVADRPIEQRFLSRVDGLCRVECFLSRRGRSRVAPVVLGLYRLGGSETGAGAPRQLVAGVTSRCRDPRQRVVDWVRAVPDSAGATFDSRSSRWRATWGVSRGWSGRSPSRSSSCGTAASASAAAPCASFDGRPRRP